ncbi:IclR family transcriptional regulator [Gaiella sp.]|uniref:IclR family transcriptional regulator n=1 Tax=Gaiella sp. TaxID=2663207 RepID=UPI0032643354
MNPGTAALIRGLEVLDTLADPGVARDGLGVVRLTELVGGDKSQLSRTLQALDERGYVDRDPVTLAYRLGWRVFGLAARAGDPRLLEAARPVLRELVREFNESVHLSVRQGDAVLTLLTESPVSTLHAPGRVGSLTPLAMTSAGRVLVCDLTSEELDTLGLQEARAAIADVTVRGFAIVREEFESGLVAAAAPIRGSSGAVVAAINVSAPLFRFEDRLEEAAARLVLAANELSGAIGGTHEPTRDTG